MGKYQSRRYYSKITDIENKKCNNSLKVKNEILNVLCFSFVAVLLQNEFDTYRKTLYPICI